MEVFACSRKAIQLIKILPNVPIIHKEQISRHQFTFSIPCLFTFPCIWPLGRPEMYFSKPQSISENFHLAKNMYRLKTKLVLLNYISEKYIIFIVFFH